MEYRILGKTGLKISRLGFGGIPIQRINEEETSTLINYLIDEGINYIDTARGYTVSESYLGKALEGQREHFILATKSMARHRDAMKKDIETSLQNLRTDYIDIYQIHNPSIDQLTQIVSSQGALEALMEAKLEGKIRHIGLTAHSLEVFEKALELDFVETIMFPYNIVETQGIELMKRCQEKNIGFIAMKPLAGGAIEDATLALRYIIDNEAVDVVIPGMADLKEIQENVVAVNKTTPLTQAGINKIHSIRKQLGQHFCRRCQYCAPCSVGINIPNVFLFEGYLKRYGLAQWAKERYASLNVKASQCIECGLCETRCPYQLPIREMLKEAVKEFGE